MGAARGLARVRREALAACMTCPLCRGLLREATAITVCLHTCEFPLLSLSLSLPPLRPWPSLSRSTSFVRAIYPRLSLPAPPPAWALVSSRSRTSFVLVSDFFLFSRSDSPGDRDGVRCEFFDPREGGERAAFFAWIVVVPFVARGGRPWWPPRAAFAFASPWPASLLETRSSARVGISCPAPLGMVLPTSPCIASSVSSACS
jgi:hypothetical protein